MNFPAASASVYASRAESFRTPICSSVTNEIVSALDPTVQVQVLLTLHRLQQERRFAMFFISHDLDVVEHISTKIAVVYRGSIVEYGPAEAVMNRPKHPYTQKLIQANRMASTRA